MTWSPLSEPINHVLLGGRRTPGIAALEGWELQHRWDERRGYGLSGATIVFRGRRLARGKLIIKLYTEQDWADWEAFRPVLGEPLPDPDATTSRSSGAASGVAGAAGAAAGASSGTTSSRMPLVPRPRALEIVHPLLDGLAVRSVVVETVKAPEQTGDGEWTIEIGLIEYRRPVPRLARPVGAQDQSPTDPADQTIERLTRIVQNEGRGDVLQALAPLGTL